jgi:chromosome partitioning protein
LLASSKYRITVYGTAGRRTNQVITAIVNDKGGVGKTMTTVFLGHGLARQGRTLIADSDPSHSAWEWSQVSGKFPPQLEVIKLTGDLHKVIPSLANDYTHVLIDTPPNDGRTMGSALLAADTAIIPVSPSTMDSNRLANTLEVFAKVQHIKSPRTFVLATNTGNRTKSLKTLRRYLDELDMPLLEHIVPRLERYLNAFGAPVNSLWHYDAVLEELMRERR